MSLALAAIIISSLTFAWTVGWAIYTQRQTTRPHLAVRVRYGEVRSEWSESGISRYFFIEATNTGQPPVTVASANLVVRGVAEVTVRGGRWVNQRPDELPIRLERGSTWTGGSMR